MKNILNYALLATLTIGAVSCERVVENSTIQQNTTNNYAAVYDLTGQNFVKNSTSGVYEIYKQFKTPIYSSDVVLIYRQNGTSGGNPVWQLIPRTLFLTEGELDYDFDYTKADILIKAGGTINFATQTQAFKDNYLNNQNFRVVIVPGTFGKANVNTQDYAAVIRYYNIDESQKGSWK